MTDQASSQPSLGSDFERPTLEQLIAKEIAKGPSGLAERIATITEKFFSEQAERDRAERAAKCPKCRERTGFKVLRSTWVDDGKYRERRCEGCNHFFRTFEKFEKE